MFNVEDLEFKNIDI